MVRFILLKISLKQLNAHKCSPAFRKTIWPGSVFSVKGP